MLTSCNVFSIDVKVDYISNIETLPLSYRCNMHTGTPTTTSITTITTRTSITIEHPVLANILIHDVQEDRELLHYIS